jgi:hypothetical protein
MIKVNVKAYRYSLTGKSGTISLKIISDKNMTPNNKQELIKRIEDFIANEIENHEILK